MSIGSVARNLLTNQPLWFVYKHWEYTTHKETQQSHDTREISKLIKA